ncbi:hypothetical protein JW988_01215 [Candidatus Bathyarchaeota archaeon]|nr:hypothetical protein [Candidatus Bathyarchaeota archaeon]
MVAKEILEVLYAPHKVFKKIVQNPGYLGPFLLLLIFVLGQVGGSYMVATRSYVETTSPQTAPLVAQGDLWTEAASYWHANDGVTVSNNTIDYINGTLATASIEFTASDANNVSMEINFDGSVRCAADAFQNVSFRVKQVTPSDTPENVSLYLYSLSDSYFYYDLTSEFSSSTVDQWNNITLTTGDGAAGWENNGATWENITGLKLEFTWSETANVDLLVDRLFFKGDYEGLYGLYGVSYLANAALNAFAPFLFEWLLLTGLMYVMIKGLKGSVIWRPLMVAVGFSLIVIAIQSIILVAVYSALPDVYYPLEVLAGSNEEFTVAYQVILDTIADVTLAVAVVQAFSYIWTVVLGTFVVRAVTGDKKIAEQATMSATVSEATTSIEAVPFSWMKCLLVSGLSLFVTIIVLGLFGL